MGGQARAYLFSAFAGPALVESRPLRRLEKPLLHGRLALFLPRRRRARSGVQCITRLLRLAVRDILNEYTFRGLGRLLRHRDPCVWKEGMQRWSVLRQRSGPCRPRSRSTNLNLAWQTWKRSASRRCHQGPPVRLPCHAQPWPWPRARTREM